MNSFPSTLKEKRQINKQGKRVIETSEVEFSETDLEIIKSDEKFNKNFKIGDVRYHDLLLLSSIELDLGKVKNLKEKVKTIEDLQKLSNLRHVTFALVVEARSEILIEVNEEK